MPKIKKNKKLQNLNEQISETIEGLNYISETDAPIKVFVGQKTDFVSAENLLLQIGRKKDIRIEEKDFTEFFAPLVKNQDWFGEDERKMTEKFIRLKNLLQQNLISKKVFQLGKIEIDIFVIGLDKDNILRGVQTKAIET